MKLRNQLLTLSLATLLVPWFGWRLVQELEQFLRAGQENALLASARTVAQALPDEFRALLIYGRSGVLPLRIFGSAPVIDGYDDEWTEPESALEFRSPDGVTRLRLLAGQYGGRLYLLCRVEDATPVRELPPGPGGSDGARSADGISVFMRSARGLNHFRIHTAAPGPLTVSSQFSGGGQLEGYWQDRAGGYDVELALPPGGALVDLSIGVLDVEHGSGGVERRSEAGTLRDGQPARWLEPALPQQALESWLAAVVPRGTRAWVLDANGWVLAAAGSQAPQQSRSLTWIERTFYRLVAGERTGRQAERSTRALRLDEPLTDAVGQGREVSEWAQDPEDAMVRNTVAVPIVLQDEQRGAVLLEASMDGLLLVTNRALGRLLLATGLVTVVLTLGLWWFATRLSRRVRRLSSAVSEAMDDAANPRSLPLTRDRDELGELARNNARLLRAVADYTGYLQKLAGRLSHELRTPLAITRSSLDNLSVGELDVEARRYLERAREGLDRQAAILRSMSEATRLEAAVRSAEWEEADLVRLLQQVAEGYRTLHAERDIRVEVPQEPVRWRCAPDLLAQALDKLVDNAVTLTADTERITLALEPGEDECSLCVRNTGSRLPGQLHEQLFDSLVSLREGGEAGRHLGLGLHIVRLVAEAHHGRALARNLPEDSGVEFRITLPASA